MKRFLIFTIYPNKAERIMNLTKSQLFTIEALNRIEGFEWPDGAKIAEVDGGCIAYFYDSLAICNNPITSVRVKDPYDKREINASVTREQFDSVDGWVRLSTGLANPSVMIEGKTVDGVDYWRYVRNEVEYKQPEEKQPSIEELYEKYQTVASDLIDAQMQVDYLKKQSEEALAEIKKWHQERGFSVSVIGEGVSTHVHNGELNITDWRDLRKGDEIECIEPAGGDVCIGDIGIVTSVGEIVITADFIKQKGYVYEGANYGVKYKFIRRP